MSLFELKNMMDELGDPEKASFLQKFFKTGPGQYGEGDVFRGIRVPPLRKLSVKWQHLPLAEVIELLQSPFHEDRLLALFILVRKCASGDRHLRSAIYDLYLGSTRFINNWDLVDCSAEHIVGRHLYEKDPEPLYRLARSLSMWERRIAVMSTFHFIKRGDFESTLRISETLLTDREDLIHKAVGWMLREVGKRDRQREEAFLEAHRHRMPRTMLRYAIERFPEPQRRRYLQRG